MVAFLTRMPAGIPGNISRTNSAKVETALLDTTNYPTAFGVPGTIDASSKNFRGIMAGDVGASVYGFYVRPYPIQSNANDPLGTSTPPTSGLANVLRSGYINVLLNSGTAAKDGQAYVRVANASAGKPVGGVEAASETTTASAPGTNTGNGTLGTLSATGATTAGVWHVLFSGATTFRVFDPNGVEYKDGATGTAWSYNGLTFTITAGGTAFAAGDTFTVTIGQNTVAIPGCTFTSPADASGNAEVAFNL